MKAIIENKIKTTGTNFIDVQMEFCNILSIVADSNTENELRERIFGVYERYFHFKIGFGSSHMWVKQIIDGDPKQQVIFVQL